MYAAKLTFSKINFYEYFKQCWAKSGSTDFPLSKEIGNAHSEGQCAALC